MAKYYVDTCIWLNLFKKEGNPQKGTPYWKLAKDFTEKVLDSEDGEIFYSPLILTEFKSKMPFNSYQKWLEYLKKQEKFKPVGIIPSDYSLARKLESYARYELSFYDCLHIAICKRT